MVKKTECFLYIEHGSFNDGVLRWIIGIPLFFLDCFNQNFGHDSI